MKPSNPAGAFSSTARPAVMVMAHERSGTHFLSAHVGATMTRLGY